MTAHSTFENEIQRSKILLKRGIILTACGFPLVIVLGIMDEMSVIHFLSIIVVMTGFITWVYSVARLRNKIKCPSCNKSLGYLLTDPSYSKGLIQFGIPDSLPRGIDVCPYCKESFENEIK